MKTAFIVVTTLIISVAAYGGNGKIQKCHCKQARPGNYMVLFVAGVEPTALAHELVKIHGGRAHRIWRNEPTGMVLESSESVAEAVGRDPRVRYVDEDVVGSLEQIAPQDPPDGPGWGLDRVNQLALPLDGNGTFRSHGIGSMIYIVDSGINNIGTEFGMRLRNLWSIHTTSSGAFIFSDQKVGVGHGTPVAAIAAGASRGIATDAQVVNVVACDDQGRCNASEVASALDEVKADFLLQNESYPNLTVAGVVNLSISMVVRPSVEEKVRACLSAGMSVAVAAGNGQESDGIYVRGSANTRTPARLGQPNTPENPYAEHTTTVGAASLTAPWAQDDIAYFPTEFVSNWGSAIDIWAPGYRVDTRSKSNASVALSGTSFATPYVAGALARYWLNELGFPVSFAKVQKVENALLQVAARNRLRDPESGTLYLGGAPNVYLYILNLGRVR